MKFKALFLVLALLLTVGIFAGCSTDKVTVEKEKKEVAEEVTTDVVTTASLVDDEKEFEKAIGKDGTWIIAALKDLKVDKELIVEGEFRDNNEATGELYRKLALYAQDEDRKVTARYTITAPKMTVKSPNTKIQSGTFVGDVYVESNGFVLTDATIDGNLYFATEENKATFMNEKESKVTGVMEVKTK